MTTDNIIKYSQELTRKHLFIILSTFSLCLLFFLAQLYLENQKEGIAKSINISGRQRMLSQRILLQKTEKQYSQYYDSKNLNSDIILFKKSHNQLLKIDNVYIYKYYQETLNKKVEEFYSILDKENVSQRDAKFVKGELLKSLNKAVTLFEKHSNEIDNLMKVINIIFLLLFSSFLSYIYLRLLRPLKVNVINSLQNYQSEKNQAQEALKAKSLFLANMSHEIRTPLNGIIGLTDIVLDSKLEGETKDNIQNIRKASESLAVIINDILDLSKIESDKITIQRSDFSPSNLVNEVLSILNPKAKSKGILLEVIDNDKFPDVINTDLQKLKQILINLTNNAIKFTRIGKVSLICDFRDGELIINIKDTGIGINESDLVNLFESFTQVENTYVKTQEGTGLGLAISKKLSNFLGGDIIVNSVYGSGSSFLVKIPVESSQNVLTIENRKKIDINFEVNNKILVAEDNLINQKVIGKTLERFSLLFDIADNGQKAIDMYKNNNYSFVLMDISMPVKNGFDAASEIYQFDKDAIIFALSANVFNEDREKALHCGMKEFLTKPLNRNELIELLNNYFPSSMVESKFK